MNKWIRHWGYLLFIWKYVKARTCFHVPYKVFKNIVAHNFLKDVRVQESKLSWGHIQNSTKCSFHPNRPNVETHVNKQEKGWSLNADKMDVTFWEGNDFLMLSTRAHYLLTNSLMTLTFFLRNSESHLNHSIEEKPIWPVLTLSELFRLASNNYTWLHKFECLLCLISLVNGVGKLDSVQFGPKKESSATESWSPELECIWFRLKHKSHQG